MPQESRPWRTGGRRCWLTATASFQHSEPSRHPVKVPQTPSEETEKMIKEPFHKSWCAPLLSCQTHRHSKSHSYHYLLRAVIAQWRKELNLIFLICDHILLIFVHSCNKAGVIPTPSALPPSWSIGLPWWGSKQRRAGPSGGSSPPAAAESWWRQWRGNRSEPCGNNRTSACDS